MPGWHHVPVQIQRAAVVGLGTMGAGIVEVLARSGLAVTGLEASEELLAKGRGRLDASLDRAVARARLDSDERAAIGSRTSFTADPATLTDVDLVVEAVPERLEIKTDLFRRLDAICPAGAIFATNTSSLPVTAIAAASGRPGRVVGMHFFNPAPVMRLVEVVSTLLTDTDARDAVLDLARRCGKTPVAVGDRAGFIANTLLVGYLGHAARLVDTGTATVADIDAAMTAACGLPMGPLRLSDLIGLDVVVEILRVLDEEFRSPRYAVAPLLRRLVLAGRLGVKSGEGFYRYDGGRPIVSAGAPPATGAAEPTQTAPAPVVLAGSAGGGAADDAVAVAAAFGGLVTVASPDGLADPHAPVLVPLGADPSRLAALRGGVPRAVGVHLPRAPRTAPVVEIVRPDTATASSLADIAAARAQAEAAGRTVVVSRPRRGYVVEALLFAHLDDAARMVGDGYASAADVDTAMTLGCGYPAGPFAMLAEVGPDAVASALPDPTPLLGELT
jgi:3-hydroxybutyryl-CoA dehydrogenase